MDRVNLTRDHLLTRFVHRPSSGEKDQVMVLLTTAAMMIHPPSLEKILVMASPKKYLEETNTDIVIKDLATA